MEFVPDCVKVPKAAYKYSPPQEIVMFGKGKKAERFIYVNQNLLPKEKQKLSELENEIRKGSLEGIPEGWSREELLRYCYGTNWKTPKILKNLKESLEWRKSFLGRDYKALLPRVLPILTEGSIYIHGRDHYFRPILVLNIAKCSFKKHSIEEYTMGICFLLEYMIENMLLPGKVENWVVIADMESQSIGLSHFKSLKKVVKVLTANYKSRLGCCYVLNAHKSVFFLWNLMKPLLDESTNQKIQISNKNTTQGLIETCDSFQVEQKYSGTAPNQTKFWPPSFPYSEHCQTPQIEESNEIPTKEPSESIFSICTYSTLRKPKKKPLLYEVLQNTPENTPNHTSFEETKVNYASCGPCTCTIL